MWCWPGRSTTPTRRSARSWSCASPTPDPSDLDPEAAGHGVPVPDDEPGGPRGLGLQGEETHLVEPGRPGLTGGGLQGDLDPREVVEVEQLATHLVAVDL